MKTLARLAFLPLLAAGLSVCLLGCTRKNSVWIYTSLYKEMIAELDPKIHAAFPGVDVQWFQGGSENVAAKLNAEMAAGKAQADLVITSDPFWYFELKQAGKLLAYDSPAARTIPAKFHDPDHAFVTSRIPVMVIGYNPEAVGVSVWPKSWKDLRGPAWKDKISLGSPLESGTSFTAVALLSKMFGWDYFADLRRLDAIAAGGNSSVIQRIETMERPVGIVLLENVLKAWGKGSPVRPIYPTDGVIPIPSPIAILKDTTHPDEARRIYDWFFSQEAQQVIVHGGMYSPVPGMESPENAMPWAELEKRLQPWSPVLLKELYSARESIKTRFSESMLR
jgi:iron(III) transport system substrate-binding protein